MNNKKFGLPITGEYSIGDKTYKCDVGKCIGLYDIGRGHFTYHTNWFWASLTYYLPDNRTFALNFGDGIGT